MLRNSLVFIAVLLMTVGCSYEKKEKGEEESKMPLLKVSENGRYIVKEDGEPFFWLGDTGWLLFSKLNRENAEKYLEVRKSQGYNVIQVMVLHSIGVMNAYGDTAVAGGNVASPIVTDGSVFGDSIQYDYWDHMDYVIDLAAEKGLYMALVPVWGSNVRAGYVSADQAEEYATFLAERYKGKPNIIWLNGGDVKGSDSIGVWLTIGETLNQKDPNHLITFHPFGRTQSSTWFHHENWLDFNMFQSGHRRYDQDDSETAYGQDNWRYVEHDYNLKPVKPTLDGEPSYEQIPQGLHDPSEPYWNDDDIRRYAYWSVFAGGAGFTYGNNAVMQFYQPDDDSPAYGAKSFWTEALNDPGASQMVYLKKLMLSKPYLQRIPDQSLIAGKEGKKYDYQVATRGEGYAFIYTYNGRSMEINMGKIEGNEVEASWYSPRNGEVTSIGKYDNVGTLTFDPPGTIEDGNDWVLVLESVN